MSAALWQSWDGARLRWRVATAAVHAGDIELCLDGVTFERRPLAEFGEREFPIAPGGRREMAFSLRTADGALVAPTWRVHFGEAATPGVDQWHGAPRDLQLLADVPVPSAHALANAPGVSIVVPIHNSAPVVQACIESVRRWSPRRARLILIDDASDEPAIDALLRAYETTPGISVLRNPRNVGYTRSCNIGIQAAGRDDVLLLNADTEVGPRWLARLRQVGYLDAGIGTATAVSDNAGAFSVPELESYCPIPPRWSLVQAQRALLQQCGGCLPELPSGNGFCMYIKREMLDRVGLLDADAFPEGYGEENDLCQRGERLGYRNVIAGDVLIRHVRSVSFGEARRLALGVKGMAILRARYPDYEEKVGATLYSFERRVLDYRVRRIYAGADGAYARRPPRPRVLVVTSDAAAHGPASGAGTRDEYDVFVLVANKTGWRLSQQDDSGARLLERIPASADHETRLRTWLLRHAIEIVHLTTVDAALERAAAELGIPVVDSCSAAVAPDPGRAAAADSGSANPHDADAGLMARYCRCIGETARSG